MVTISMEVDSEPLFGWRGQAVDHVGQQVAVFERRPLVGNDGLFKRTLVEGASVNLELSSRAVWSDGRHVDSNEVLSHLKTISADRLHYDMRHIFHPSPTGILACSPNAINMPLDLIENGLIERFRDITCSPRGRAVTGPYQLRGKTTGVSSVYLTRNPMYETSSIADDFRCESLLLVNLEGSVNNIDLYRCGGIDATAQTATFPEDLCAARRDEDWVESQTIIAAHLLFNPCSGPTSRTPFRRKVAAGLRRSELVKAAYGLADPAYCPSDVFRHPTNRLQTDDTQVPKQNALRDSCLTLLCSEFMPNPSVLNEIANQLELRGARTTVHSAPWKEFVSRVADRSFDVALILIPLSCRLPYLPYQTAFCSVGVNSCPKPVQDAICSPTLDLLTRLYEAYVPTTTLYSVRAGAYFNAKARRSFCIDYRGLVVPR